MELVFLWFSRTLAWKKNTINIKSNCFEDVAKPAGTAGEIVEIYTLPHFLSRVCTFIKSRSYFR